MPTITPFLMFADRMDEALALYTSLFPDARVVQGRPAVLELQGQTFYAFEGGPHFKFTEAVSIFVSCDTQEEIDRYWNALVANGGRESQCGWLEDPYGLSWQICPASLIRQLADPAPEKAERAFQAMLTMTKLDKAALDTAFEG